ncbi:MAG TPA: tetratricopeptide repeat protein [Isosphaeraceae bacterium]|nr:tetratricopeptide repeat protein [Isosphaeraceae bacterium]
MTTPGDEDHVSGRVPTDGAGSTPPLSTLAGPFAVPGVALRDEDGLSTAAPPSGAGSDRKTRTIRPLEAPTTAAEGAGARVTSLRYELLDELGRGGMGLVVRARDRDLGRDVALKVLLESRRDDPELVRRFVEEAQICGQLQHPGVVPVHELGTLADRRPYFTMRLVKGETLSALLRARPDPGHDRPRLLGILEAACQTVAYAHARGVIHRDLKPANVMVGAFGVVQVMDWGLAKVLTRDGDAVAAPEAAADLSVIMTDRGDSGEHASRAGAVMGTPAYMAPEQARGEVHLVDERADVFGLGAILCDFLTGAPAFVGRSTAEVHRKAALGDVADALARLASCDADPELLSLARDCLAPERDDRPRDAGAVAGRMTAYLAGVQDRLRAAEIERAAAQARAEEEVTRRALADSLAQEARARAASEARRRRATVGLAASILALVVLGGGGGAYLLQQRRVRQLRVNLAFDEVGRLRDLAARDPDGDVSKWHDAQDSLRHVDDLLAGLADARVRARFDALSRELAAATAAAEADRSLIDELDEIRTADFEEGRRDRADVDYVATFRAAGLDADRRGPESVGSAIARRPPGVALAIASALDDWSRLRRDLHRPAVEWRRPLAAARAADPDPWRRGLRDALERGDLAALRHLADGAGLDRQPSASLVLLGLSLDALRDHSRAQAVLNAAVRAHPADFWAHRALAAIGHDAEPPRYEEALRHLTATLALRPNSPASHARFGDVLRHLGRPAEAVAEHREALRLRPDNPAAHNGLGLALDGLGRPAEAVAEFKEALRLRPEYPEVHNNLGNALGNLGKPAEAVVEYEEALRLRPDNPGARYNLGNSLQALGKSAEAVAEFKEALRLRPEYPEAHVHLGLAFKDLGRHAEAVAAYKEALRLRPELPQAHANLGVSLYQLGDTAGASAEFRRARELVEPNSPMATSLNDLIRRTELEGAVMDRLPAGLPGLFRRAEAQARLVARLPGVLRGDDRPKNDAEAVAFASLAAKNGLHVAATRLYESTFAADPKFAEDLAAGHRHDAARAAARAGCGPGKDKPPPDEASRARLRKQALDWLKADLQGWRRSPTAGPKGVAQALRRWQAEPDLAGLRDADALARLPEDERRACRALWDDVAATLKAVGDAPKAVGAGP